MGQWRFQYVLHLGNDGKFTGSVGDRCEHRRRRDNSRETEATRILRYVVRADRVTEFVSADDEYPPQFGLHYMTGFENERRIRWREGIYAESRSTFRVYDNQLYYRYRRGTNLVWPAQRLAVERRRY